jgi:hypothetical protein
MIVGGRTAPASEKGEHPLKMREVVRSRSAQIQVLDTAGTICCDTKLPYH